AEAVVHVRVDAVFERGALQESIFGLESLAARRLRNLTRRVVHRVRRERRQRTPGAEIHADAEIQAGAELIVPVHLSLVTAIERERPDARGAEVADVAAEPERATHRDVGWVVGREVEQRRDPGIRLTVVVPEEAFEVAGR